MRVLGIDPGSITTGYGVVEHTKSGIALVDQGCVKTPRGANLDARLQLIFEGLRDVIDRNRPDTSAIESPFGGKNVKSLIQLAHARGVAILALRLGGLEVTEYAPRTIKSQVVGYGGAEKQQVARMVKMLLEGARDVKLESDAADALAVAICHAYMAKFNLISRKAEVGRRK
jgi:crossover junction endodeoxyribonuclease RuvC